MESLVNKKINQYHSSITGILHVGACLCEEIDIYEKYVSRNNILWIEALNEKVNINRNKYNNLLIENAVVSDIKETVDFKCANWDSASSFLDLGLCNDLYPEIHYINSFKVETKLLKDIIVNYDISFNFINLDIQGCELKALHLFTFQTPIIYKSIFINNNYL